MTSPSLAHDFSHVKGVIWDFDGTKTRHLTEESMRDYFEMTTLEAIKDCAREAGIDHDLSDAQIRGTFRDSYQRTGFSFMLAAQRLGLDCNRVYHIIHDRLDFHATSAPVPGLRDAFEKVAATHRHVIVSHGSHRWVKSGMSEIYLREFYSDDDIISIGDVGLDAGKDKSRRLYDMALERLELPPENVAVVEDTDKNLLIPHQMSMTSVLLQPAAVEIPYVHAQFPTATDFLRALAPQK